jgi:phosphoserine aminotransferase
MNVLGGRKADYIITGSWSQKAIKEAKRFGEAKVAFDGDAQGDGFMRLPRQDELELTGDAHYVHVTSNNTIKGTQFFDFPDTGNVPLVCDMSSDIFSHTFDASRFGIIYAGAQKNLGPSGVTLVAMRDDFFQSADPGDDVFTMMRYSTHIEKDSLFNTPPSFGIYLMGEVLKWIKENGGVKGMEERNKAKADLLYGFLDDNSDFFSCPVEKGSRSWMNVCFRLPSEELEAKLVAEAKEAGYIGLKGHRSVGGLRISMYNANGLDAVEDVVDFMKQFMETNG